MPQTVYIFDFDGTLTTRDTLLEFIRYAKGPGAFVIGFLLHAPLLVAMKLRLYPNYKAKQRIFSYYFKGCRLTDFDDICRRFARDHGSKLLRPQGLATLRQALEARHRVLIVSASIDNWVRPFFSQIPAATAARPDSAPAEAERGAITVLGTRVEFRDGRLTGRFLTPNCYGAEKVRRVLETLTEPRPHYHIIAFGDSRGDKELLNYADEPHYKPFRR